VPIDYRRLVDALGTLALPHESSELVSVQALVAALCDCSGAVGGTFTEYGARGGRVVVARGAMAWALGQLVSPELAGPEIIGEPFCGRVEAMPPDVAQPLLDRGVVAVAGHPVRSGGRVVGALHLFFDAEHVDGGHVDAVAGDAAELEAVNRALRVVAAFATNVYTGREATPVRSPGEEDDRSLFLTVAGHELRTPVTAIKGYASLLADRWDSLDDGQRLAATKVITQRADELARLVDRVLGATAGEAATVRVVPFDPIDALMRAVSGMVEELRRTVRLELPNSLPPASGDPDVNGTVVTELVTNAVRAGSPDSTVDITAGADTDTVFIQVRDRGIGIDPAQTDRAFERFWRGPRSSVGERDQGSAGVGLGLYLVRRLVERQNGWVSLRPRDGGGTIAEVRLARADAGPAGRGADQAPTGEA